jgi:hypothetical protein
LIAAARSAFICAMAGAASSAGGCPIARPAWFSWPAAGASRGASGAWTVGDSLLVVPLLAAAGGGRIVRAARPTHGRTSQMHHDGVNLFAGIPSPMTACRYHSLVVEAESLPDGLVAVARDEEGTIMAIADDRRCAYGVQFHPESVLTEGGHRMVANWLEMCGDLGAVERSRGLAPVVHRA